MKPHDGGPAFPVPNDANVNGQEGMSLLDFFAAHALNGYLSTHTGVCDDCEAKYTESDATTARNCYRLAYAMLVERAKSPPTPAEPATGGQT